MQFYNGEEAIFIKLADLIDKIEDAEKKNEERKLPNNLLQPKLLVIDELDNYQTSDIVSEFLWLLIERRHEKGSIMFTGNVSFDSLDKLFGNPKRTAKVIDRILEHAVIVKMQGDSQRVPSPAFV